MRSELVFKLFKKYVNNKININNIFLYPIEISENYVITYNLENPNQISFSKTSIEGYLEDITRSFLQVTGFDINIVNDVDSEQLYVNNILRKKLSDYFSSINKLTFDDGDIYVEHESIEFNMVDRTLASLQVINYVKPIGTRAKGKKSIMTNTSSIFRLVRRYELWQHDFKYMETELIYEKFDSIFDDELTLVDPQWMVQYVKTVFI